MTTDTVGRAKAAPLSLMSTEPNVETERCDGCGRVAVVVTVVSLDHEINVLGNDEESYGLDVQICAPCLRALADVAESHDGIPNVAETIDMVSALIRAADMERERHTPLVEAARALVASWDRAQCIDDPPADLPEWRRLVDALTSLTPPASTRSTQ
jgi:hypothetical protein